MGIWPSRSCCAWYSLILPGTRSISTSFWWKRIMLWTLWKIMVLKNNDCFDYGFNHGQNHQGFNHDFDDTSLFSVVKNIHTNANTLSQHLNVITNWTFQWKVIFNPDWSKQAQEIMLSWKVKKLLHPSFLSNNIPLNNSLFRMHLGLTL